MVYLVSVVAVMVGFIAGLATLKRSSRWCPGCGQVLRCGQCPGRPAAHESRASLSGGNDTPNPDKPVNVGAETGLPRGVADRAIVSDRIRQGGGEQIDPPGPAAHTGPVGSALD